MPFDPAKPANNAAIVAPELRAQFTAINTDVQTRATTGAVATAIAGTASNCNGVALLDFAPSDPPTQADVQALFDKMNELLNATRR